MMHSYPAGKLRHHTLSVIGNRRNGMDTLRDGYELIEEESLSYKYPTEIADIFKSIGEKLLESEDKIGAQKCQWEIDTFNFTIRDNELLSMMSGTDRDGNPIEYPSLRSFNNETYEYLSVRLSESRAPRLLARYSHLLWLSPAKSINHAKIAIDSYLSLAKQYTELDKKEPEEMHGHNVIGALKNAVLISIQIKQKTELTKPAILDAIKVFPKKSKWFYSLRLQLLRVLLQKRKFTEKEELSQLLPYYEELDQELDDSEDGLWKSLDVNKSLIELSSKIENDPKPYKVKRAECYEKLSLLREANAGMISLDFCVNAINIYKEIGDKKKVKSLEKRYHELKTKVNLQKVSTEFDATEIVNQIRELAESISNKDSDEIIQFLIHDPQLIPSHTYLYEEALRSKEQEPLMFLVNTQIYDRNGHVSQHFGTEDESIEHSMLQTMAFHIRLQSGLLMHEILFKSIAKGKITTAILSQYIHENCWFGVNIKKDLPSGETMEYNWLNIIIPAIDSYIQKVKILLYNPNTHVNLVTELDSLTLKFESLIRDFTEFLGGATFFQTKDKSGRVITREKDINALLHEDVIKKMIDPSDHFYLRFLLIEKAGMNLRNNVAHGFLTYEEYNTYSFHLVLLGFFRLAKYDFKREKADNK